MFLALWVMLFRDLARIWPDARDPVLVLGLGGALLTYFLRSFSDHFPASGLITSTRVSFLLWTLLAAGVAVIRLAQRDQPVTHA